MRTTFGTVRWAVCMGTVLSQGTSVHADAQRLRALIDTSTPKASTPHGAAGAAFDTKRGRAILFGNMAPPNEDSKPGLVSFDPAKKEFQAIATVGASPSGTAYPSVTYDPRSDSVYVFGGWALEATNPTNELWMLTLAGNDPISWKRLTPKGKLPPARNGAVMVLDQVRDRLVLHGGDGGPHPEYGYTPLDDLWSFELKTGMWELLTPTGPSPEPRWNHSGANDDESSRMFVFGGTGYTPTLQPVRDNDLYILDLEKLAWSRHVCDGACPDSRQGATLTFDQDVDALILVGGLRNATHGSSGTTSIWLYDLIESDWSKAKSADRKYRRAHTATYDPVGKQHIVHGGQTAWSLANHYAKGQPLYDTMLISIMREK